MVVMFNLLDVGKVTLSPTRIVFSLLLDWKEYHVEVGKLMTSELLGLGLLDKADVQNESKEKPAYKKYFMHGTSHHMGLDTHDYGLLNEPMVENMVFTVEPGIYLPDEGLRLVNKFPVQQ